MIAHGTQNEDGELEYIGAVQDVTNRQLSEEALGQGALGAGTRRASDEFWEH